MEVRSKIQRLTLDITYTNPSVTDHALTERIRNLFDDELAPAIDVAFSYNESAEKYYIDTCVIDLGEIEEKDFSSLLKIRLQQQFKTIQQSIDTSIISKTGRQENYSTEDILFYFLTTGRLPWYAPIETIPDELFNQLLHEHPEIFTKNLLILFHTNKTVIYRFALQFENETIFSFLKKAVALLPNVIRHMARAWLNIIQLQSIDILQINREEKIFILGNYLAEVINTTITKDKLTLIQSFITEVVTPSTHMSEKEITALETELAENSSASVKFVESLITLHITNVQQKDGSTQPKQSDPTNTSSGSNQSVPETEKDSIAIENAGLVLLNPFLPHFFMLLELTKENDFISIKHQEKAVQILHYVATGNTKTPEQLLSLCKILVSLPLHHPIEKQIKLTDNEKVICKDLLQAVTANWPPLKQTSIEGLRESFIQRKGTMVLDAEAWMITVERKTIDVLLEQIGWSFSIIAHPWNKQMIHVKW